MSQLWWLSPPLFCNRSVHPMYEKNTYWSIFFTFYFQLFSGQQLYQNNWIIEIQFLFWLIPKFCTNLVYSTKFFNSSWFFKIIYLLNLAASNWIQMRKHLSILNFDFLNNWQSSFCCRGSSLSVCSFCTPFLCFLSDLWATCLSGLDQISDSHFFQFFLHSAIKTNNFEHSQNLQACANITQLSPMFGDIPWG